ncbi:MAG: hypothetical protein ACLFNK_05600 [Candidatus Woesearchaeota archaeon]
MSNKQYIDMLKEDFDTYASVANGAARYMRQIITEDEEAYDSRLELKLKLEDSGIEIEDSKLDDFLHDVVEDIYFGTD